MLKILNLVPDMFYTNQLIDVCEYTKGKHQHYYIILSNSEHIVLHSIKRDNVEILKGNQLFDFIETNNINVVVLHGLGTIPIEQIAKIPSNIKVVWFAWGYDIYTSPHFLMPFIKVNLYHRLTKKLLCKGLANKKHILNGLVYQLLKYRTTKNSISRIDYFSGVIPEEYTLISKKKYFRAKEVTFNYFSISDPTEKLSTTLTDTDFLVGNSGDPTNNHIDLFYLLKERGLDNKKIIVPLSYGGTAEYKEKVINLGKDLFGDNFIPLTEFLPTDKYYELISSCSNIVMGHERQQAVGNIMQSIWLGKKVFLSSSSIVYKHLKNLGYNVYSIQKDLHAPNADNMLDEESVRQNKDTYMQNYSTSVKLENLKKTYSILEEDIKKTYNQ